MRSPLTILFLKLSLVLLITSATTLAAAKVSEAECTFKDYSSRFVSPKDQGNAGFCYSFAASDLLSEATSVKPPDTVSAFHAASQYVSMSPEEVEKANAGIAFENPSVPESIPMGGMSGAFGPVSANPNYRLHDPSGKPLLKREGGQTDLIASHLIQQGHVCLEKEVPSEMIDRNYKDQDQQNFFAIQMGTLAGGAEVKKLVNNKSLYSTLQQSCVAAPPLKGLNQLLPLKAAIQDWAAQHLREQSEKLCEHPVSTKGLKVHSRSFINSEKNPNAVKYMMSVLGNDRPFALHYDPSIMANVSSGWHSSIVTGRKWNSEKQTCEIAIKNSWGENCELAKEKGTCDKGRWWVDIEALANSKSEVIWIDKGAK